MNDQERDEWLELAHAYVEQRLDPEQAAKIEERLEDPEARRIFSDFCHDHAALCWETMPETGASEIAEFSEFRPRRLPTLWQALAACAVVSLLALVATSPFSSTPAADTFALMESTASARWESGDLPTADGARLGAGTLRLARGLATIAFDSGAEIVLEAPAELELIDEMNCVLVAGTAVAEMPESAHGFEIRTPTAKVIDHGTRFAVNVSRENGATRTQVFDGLVEVALPDGKGSVELRSGQRNFVAGDSLGPAGAGIEEDTWAPSVRRLPRGDGWHEFSTADPGAGDTYVWGGEPNDHVSDELLLLKNSSDLAGPHRKAYLRFDLSRLSAGELAEAALELRFAPTGWGLASLVEDSVFAVYGIVDDSLDGWQHGGFDWQSAPANRIDSGDGLLEDRVRLLGEFTVPRGIQSGSFGIRGEELADFLSKDENRLASLVVVRRTVESRGGGLVHAFASSRHPSLPAPRLSVRIR